MYTRYGASFYTDANAGSQYDARLQAILDYKGRHTQRVWKEFSDLIVAFDLQNEPYVGMENCAAISEAEENWVCARARFLRNTVLPPQSPIQISSGGLGGDVNKGCGTPRITVCPELDLFASESLRTAAHSRPD